MGILRTLLTGVRRVFRNVWGSWAGLAIFVAGALACIAVSMRYEAEWLPVVTDFRVTSRISGPTEVSIVAELSKVRACAFVGVTVYVGDPWDSARPRERLPVRLIRDSGSPTLEAGRQRIGPITIGRPMSDAGPMAFMVVRHRCHPLWVTAGIYFMQQRDVLFAPSALAPEPTTDGQS